MNSLKLTHSECEGCGGVCCQYRLRRFQIINFIAAEYYKQRAEKIIKLDNEFNIAMLYQPCPLFNKKTGTCSDYKNRNSTCKDWPVSYSEEWAQICALTRSRLEKKRTGKYQVLKI